jgi:hypothetical protein
VGSYDETGRRLASRSAHPSSLARSALRRQTPKVGAGCPNRARPDPCGGCPVMGIPTAILHPLPTFGRCGNQELCASEGSPFVDPAKIAAFIQLKHLSWCRVTMGPTCHDLLFMPNSTRVSVPWERTKNWVKKAVTCQACSIAKDKVAIILVEYRSCRSMFVHIWRSP